MFLASEEFLHLDTSTMTSSELHRKLLYCGFDNISAYTSKSPINRYMNQLLLDVCREYQIEVGVLSLFNEIYYQCVRIQYDGKPDIGVYKRYMIESRAWLKSDQAAELVFCMVWAIYKRRKYYNSQGDILIQKIKSFIADSEFMKTANRFVQYMEENNLHTPSLFSAMPIPVKQIPKRIDLKYHTSMTLKEKIFSFFSLQVESSAKDFNPWRNVTDNYSNNVILFYIKLYRDRESQLALLERIQSACTKEEHEGHRVCFDMLKDQILYGDYVPLSGMFYDKELDWDTMVTHAEITVENLNCGTGSEADSRVFESEKDYEEATSSDMAARAGKLIGSFGEETLRDPQIRKLIGEMLAAKAYTSYDDNKSYMACDEELHPVVDFLRRTQLKVEIDDKTREITTSAEVVPHSDYVDTITEEHDSEDRNHIVTVNSKDGKTVYVIQNLNINLSAEVIHQLNVNPQEVINHYHEMIQEEIKRYRHTNSSLL